MKSNFKRKQYIEIENKQISNFEPPISNIFFDDNRTSNYHNINTIYHLHELSNVKLQLFYIFHQYQTSNWRIFTLIANIELPTRSIVHIQPISYFTLEQTKCTFLGEYETLNSIFFNSCEYQFQIWSISSQHRTYDVKLSLQICIDRYS